MLRDDDDFQSSDPNPANFGFFKKKETENHNTWAESTFCITIEASFFLTCSFLNSPLEALGSLCFKFSHISFDLLWQRIAIY